MIRYYQTSEKSVWNPIADSQTYIEDVRKLGGTKVTILATDYMPDSGSMTDKKAKYKGPMYFDIDRKGDIYGAAQSCLSLLEKLQDRGADLEYVQIFASGSKGFHVLVPMAMFHREQMTIDLPYIYKRLALSFYVDGMDFQVYCGGKGNCFRIENLKREDTGTYRVQVRPDELKGMTEERYKEIVSAPRDIVVQKYHGEPIPALLALYTTAKNEYQHKTKEAEVVVVEDLKRFNGDLPGCVQAVRDGRVSKNSNFNKVALHLACFLVRSGTEPALADSVIGLAAKNSTSSMYNTDQKRYQHIMGLMHFVGNSENYQFSCSGMRTVAGSTHCKNCQLYQTQLLARETDDNYGIVIGDKGYHRDTKGFERITNFLIKPLEFVKDVDARDEDDNTMEEDVAAIVAHVQTIDGLIFSRKFPERCWTSKSAFMEVLHGIPTAGFFGGETDLQRIKQTILTNTSEQREEEGASVGEIYEVRSAGIHYTKIGKHETFTYVEPGYSITAHGATGTHKLVKRVMDAPQLSKITEVNTRNQHEVDEVKEFIYNLCRVNSSGVVACVLGWFSASFLKKHFKMTCDSQFPLLNLCGGAGSGKSQTAALFWNLHGVPADGPDRCFSTPLSSYFAVCDYVSSTTTVPRILDEFNAMSTRSFRTYSSYLEILKAAFNEQPLSRGTIGGDEGSGKRRKTNATVDYTHITSPICYISEQPQDQVAVRHRTVQVLLTPNGRIMGAPYFNRVKPKMGVMHKIGLSMLQAALQTPLDSIKQFVELQDHYLPANLEPRPKYGFKVVQYGLKFIEDTMKEAYGINIHDDIEMLREGLEALIEEAIETLATDTSITEVDKVMRNIMTILYLPGSSRIELQRGKHFEIDGNLLLCDIPIIFDALSTYYILSGKPRSPISEVSQFLKLIRSEPYFIGLMEDSRLPIGRKVLSINLSILERKGIDVYQKG